MRTPRRRHRLGALVATAALAGALVAATGSTSGAIPEAEYRGPGPIHLDNPGEVPYTGGSAECPEGDYDAAWDEWHFIINGLNAPPSGAEITPPSTITAVFETPTGEVIVEQTNLNQAEAGYTEYGHLEDTLIDAYMTLPDGQDQWGGLFLLSHAPCDHSEELGQPLRAEKTAAAAYDRTYGWTVDKSVDQTHVDTFDTTATFNYTVSVSHDEGTDGNWRVSGDITIENPNEFAVPASLSDAVPGADCTVGDGSGAVEIPAMDSVTVSYSCLFSAQPESATGTNTASITWDAIESLVASGTSADADYDFSATTPTESGACADVSDSVEGSLGSVCVGDSNPTTYTYSRTVDVPRNSCVSYDNTATYTTTDEDPATGSDDQSVSVCGPITGGLSKGYWTNKNGQNQIKYSIASGGVCGLTPFLRAYKPFQDLVATASCNTVATYVLNVVKAADAAGASMNAMLKAQMLAAAIDAYFNTPSGTVKMNLAQVCTDLTCTSFEDTSTAPAVFGGAACLSINDMLAYASTASNVGGSVWYGQIKYPDQEYAKDAFEAIANQRAFACT